MAIDLAQSMPENERRKMLDIWETAPGLYGWLGGHVVVVNVRLLTISDSTTSNSGYTAASMDWIG